MSNISINSGSNEVGDTSQKTMVKNLELFREYYRDFTFADKNRHTSVNARKKLRPTTIDIKILIVLMYYVNMQKL